MPALVNAPYRADMSWMVRTVLVVLLAAFTPLPCLGANGLLLPVYIEDNHAGSFYWFARNLDRSERYHLILFDQHSDATAVLNSDVIRDALDGRDGPGDAETHFADWKKRGVIQSFNWIEPLLPNPINGVTWIPGEHLTPQELEAKQGEIARHVNAHEEAFPRASGNLASLFTVRDFARQKEVASFDGPVVVSIDLDYFSDVPDQERELRFSELVDYAMSIRPLKAVTIAISRPYLKSDEQADALFFVALKHFSKIINANIYFEPFALNGPDRSELAKSLYRKKLPVPSYDARKALSRLVSLILQDPSRIVVTHERRRWDELLQLWAKKYPQPALSLHTKGHVQRKASCNAFHHKEDLTLSVKAPVDSRGDVQITWYAVAPAAKSYNMLGKNYGFAEDAPRLVRFNEIRLNHVRNRKTVEASELNDLFDEKTGLGTIRLFAEVVRNNTSYRTPPVCISRYAGRNYPGRLTEIFNLPYVLGGGLLNIGNLPGADARYGADCLGFIIYGKRRMGARIPYNHGNNLRAYLADIGEVLFFKGGVAYNNQGPISINEQMISDGLLLHFGTHIAALYQDNEPRNILNDDDLVVHQLENMPEIIELKKLKQANQPFMLMKFR